MLVHHIDLQRKWCGAEITFAWVTREGLWGGDIKLTTKICRVKKGISGRGKSKCKGPEAAVLGQSEDEPGHWCGWSRVGPGERGEVGREVSQVEGSRVC